MKRRTRSGLVGLALGLALIWLLFVPVLGDRGFGVDVHPPVALFVVLVLLGLLGQMRWPLAAWLRWPLAGLIVVLALLQLAAGAVGENLDRALDLYFDAARLPDLIALYLKTAGGRGAAVMLGAVLGLAFVSWLTGRALVAIEQAVARPATSAGALAVGLLGLALTALPFGHPINAAAAVVGAQQVGDAWRDFAVFHGFDDRYAAALRAPQLPAGPLPGLRDKDVYLVFVGSYGTVTLDDPGYRQVLQPALDDFAATVQDAGYTLLSSRLVSPVFGGGSWLAHGSLASGIKLDAVSNELLLHSERKALPRYMSAAGYRTVEVMPGIKKPDPEAAFGGSTRSTSPRLSITRGRNSAGSISRINSRCGNSRPMSWRPATSRSLPRSCWCRATRLSRRCRLTSPIGAMPAISNVPAADWPRIYAQPDWNNLDRPYLDSIAYDLKTLGAWLKGRDRDALVIILGDHQPPEITRVAGQPYTVPVYVLSRDGALVQPFAALGYAPGDTPPPRNNPEGMENFLGEFLRAFSVVPTPQSASAQPQTPDAPAASQP